MRKIFTLILSLIMSLSFVFAGTVGKIAGRVIDANTGEALIGVNVYIQGTDLGTATDIDGSFVILNISPGKYDVTFNYLGYNDVIVKGVSVNADFTSTLEIEMKEAVVELGVVEVIAEREVIRKDQTSSLSVVNGETIKELPVDDINGVLQIKAGVTRDAAGGFHLRGGRSSEVNYMVDGVTATDAFDGSVAYDVEKSAVSELQVISGTFNAEYGSAMSGIVNIITKDGGDDFSGQVSAFSGGYATSDNKYYFNAPFFNIADVPNVQASVSGPIIKNQVNFFLSGRLQRDEGYLWGRREYNYDGSIGDGADVPMNNRDQGYAQAKLTWKIQPTLKLSYSFVGNYQYYRDYENGQKLSPDGRLKRHQFGLNNTVKLDHTINNKFFYTINFSSFSKEYYHYAWSKPKDAAYVDPDAIDAQYLPSNGYSFIRGKTDNQRFNRETRTLLGKGDFTYQSGEHHLIQAGFEYKNYTIDYKDVTIYRRGDVFPFNPELDYETEAERLADPNFSKYQKEPREYSLYLQDKMEYESFVVNFGLRFDAFDPNTLVPKDKYASTPDIYSDELPFFDDGVISGADKNEFYKETSMKYQVSPRIGVAYSVTENSKLHFSYGQFLKMPTMELLYLNSQYRVLPASKYGNLMGNPDLKPENTIAYEVGFSTRLSQTTGLNITAFYKDIRDYVGTSTNPTSWNDNAATGYGFYSYVNLDYANIRGFTFAVNRGFLENWAFSVDYTYMVAEGTASDPGEYYSGNVENTQVNRFIFPLNWDQTHTLNTTIFYDFYGWGASLIGSFLSGQPYTPSFASSAPTGLSSLERAYPKNQGNKPAQTNIDFNLRKRFELTGNLALTWFLRVYNIFDIRNELFVFDDTGRSTYSVLYEKQREDEIASGIQDAPDFVRWGTFEEYYRDPSRFGRPRLIQSGVTVEF